MEQLTELKKLHEHAKLSFICGDFNYDLVKTQYHDVTTEFISGMYDSEFVPYILKPTCVTHTSSTLIDNIFMKSTSLSRNWSYVIVDPMSDHYPCLVLYELNRPKSTDETVIEKRKLNESALLKLQEKLLFHDWTCLDNMCVEESYHYLVDMITSHLDEIAPKRVICIWADEKFRELWITAITRKPLVKLGKTLSCSGMYYIISSRSRIAKMKLLRSS